MVRFLVGDKLVYLVAVALTGLLLFGSVTGSQLLLVLVFFAALRAASILVERFRKPLTPERLAELDHQFALEIVELSEEERTKLAETFGLAVAATKDKLRRAYAQQLIAADVPRRGNLELSAELAGLAGFLFCLPLLVALLSLDFFSIRRPQGWEGCLVVGVAVLLYSLPHLARRAYPSAGLRTAWWAGGDVLQSSNRWAF